MPHAISACMTFCTTVHTGQSYILHWTVLRVHCNLTDEKACFGSESFAEGLLRKSVP